MPESAENWQSWQELQAIFLSATADLQWRDVGVLVGCSGGADSVALLRVLVAQLRRQGGRGFVVAAHLNHQLRGEESAADERFVKQLAESMGVDFIGDRLDQPASDESSLRAERMRFFEAAAHRIGARYVAAAHSADDNAETILHHLMRGTGPTGLAGIRRLRPLGEDLVLVRPFLTIRRQLIRQALREIAQPWREDSSNLNLEYRRNWIRHQLIPLIESQFPAATDAICRAAGAQRDWCEVIEQHSYSWLAAHWDGSLPVRIQRGGAANQPLVIAACNQLFSTLNWPRQQMSQRSWQRLAEAIGGVGEESFSLPGKIQVDVDDHVVELRRV